MKKPVLLVALLLGLAALALAQNRPADGRAVQNHPKISRDLQSADPGQAVNVIVQFKQIPSERQHQSILSRGARLRGHLTAIKAIAYSMPAASLAELEADANVTYVSPDRPVQGAMDLAGAATNAAIEFQYGFDGTGVTVAVIDSGIMDSHPDLHDSSNKSRVVYSQSFNSSSTPCRRKLFIPGWLRF